MEKTTKTDCHSTLKKVFDLINSPWDDPVISEDLYNEISKCLNDKVLDDVEVLDVVDLSDTIGADIRNKLTPMKNLLAMLKLQKDMADPKMKESLKKLIDNEIDQCEISIDYLTKLL